MAVTLAIAAAAAATIAGTGVTTGVASAQSYSVASWQIEAYELTGGQGCSAQRANLNGDQLTFTVGERDGTTFFYIRARDQRWSRPIAGRVAVRLSIDDASWRNIEARVFPSPDSLNIGLTGIPGGVESLPIWAELRRGRSLQIHGTGFTFQFPLTGTAEMLPSLARCGLTR